MSEHPLSHIGRPNELVTPEQAVKLDRIRALLQRRGLNALLLTRAANIAWLSGGARVYVDVATDQGIAALLVTPAGRLLLTDNIEAPRLRDEEPLAPFGLVAHPWYEADDDIAALSAGLLVGADGPGPHRLDVSADLMGLRSPLLAVEVDRLRSLGSDVGQAMLQVARTVERGMSEHQVAGLLAKAIYDVGAVPVVVQVAAGGRAERFRHALPTDARLETTLLWGVCARRHGLIVSASRLLCFGPVPNELRRKLRATVAVEAAALAATRPGVPLAEVFARIQEAWTTAGHPEAWRQHHQGGPCSYSTRDAFAAPDSTERVQAPQAFAWNPSLPGAKSEDTALITDSRIDFLTRSPNWPMIKIIMNGEDIIGNDVYER